MTLADLPMLHEWLSRPHVANQWGPRQDYAAFEKEFALLLDACSPVRGYIAMLDQAPIGFMQSYAVMNSGDGWWKTKPIRARAASTSSWRTQTS